MLQTVNRAYPCNTRWGRKQPIVVGVSSGGRQKVSVRIADRDDPPSQSIILMTLDRHEALGLANEILTAIDGH